MKKAGFFIVFFIMIAGCAPALGEPYQDSGTPSSPRVDSMRFEDISEERNKDISIVYPQVSGLLNIDFQNELNERLSPPYFEFYLDDETMNHVWYEYSIISDIMFSFRFYMVRYSDGMNRPYPSMWAVNVNVETEEYPAFSGVVRIDDDFKALFLNGIFVSGRFPEDEDLPDSRERLYERIYDFYLTEDSFGVITGVCRTAGGYLTFEAKYSDVERFLKIVVP